MSMCQINGAVVHLTHIPWCVPNQWKRDGPLNVHLCVIHMIDECVPDQRHNCCAADVCDTSEHQTNIREILLIITNYITSIFIQLRARNPEQASTVCYLHTKSLTEKSFYDEQTDSWTTVSRAQV